jgi:hypothetical protein
MKVVEVTRQMGKLFEEGKFDGLVGLSLQDSFGIPTFIE